MELRATQLGFKRSRYFESNGHVITTLNSFLPTLFPKDADAPLFDRALSTNDAPLSSGREKIETFVSETAHALDNDTPLAEHTACFECPLRTCDTTLETNTVVSTCSLSGKEELTGDVLSLVFQEKVDAADFAVFDTETSGFSKNAIVIQICIALFDENCNKLFVYTRLLTPPSSITIEPRSEEVHKISMRKLQSDGTNFKLVLQDVKHMFKELKIKKKPIVAHNAAFDSRMLTQTATRAGMHWPFNVSDYFCTQQNSRGRIKVYNKSGRIKAPTNVELYTHFCTLPDGVALHDAEQDCMLTAVGYHRGKQLMWWHTSFNLNPFESASLNGKKSAVHSVENRPTA